jgi:hypothetical protein
VQQTNLFPQFKTIVIFVPLIMATLARNVLQIPLPKFHDSNDVVTHVGKLAKVCVMNGEGTNAHKITIFPYHIKREKYKLVHFL